MSFDHIDLVTMNILGLICFYVTSCPNAGSSVPLIIKTILLASATLYLIIVTVKTTVWAEQSSVDAIGV